MILTAREKEVQFWIHLGNPNLPGPDVMDSSACTDQRPPLLPRSEAHALLLRALKEKSLRADETRALYDSAKRPREEIPTSRASSPLSSAGPRIQTPKLLKSASTTAVRARVPKQHRPLSYHVSTTSLQQRSSVKLSLPQRSPVQQSLQQRPPVNLTSQQRSLGKLPLQQRFPVKLADGVPPAPRPPPSPLRTRVPPSRITSNGLTWLHKNIIDSWDREFFQGANTDVTIYTSDGHELHAHSTVLTCGSPILKHMLQEQFGPTTRRCFLNIRGVPFQAVRCFVRFLYSSRCEQEDMEKFSLHLLVLAHAYMVPSLKRVCSDSYEHGLLNSDNVVDVLHVARLCDASRLHLLCWRRIVADFKAVSRSDGWRIMKESDPKLEQELVEAVVEVETRRRERERRVSDDDKVYAQLREAMEALAHICQHGCRFMSAHGSPVSQSCSFPACKGLEHLVRHFAACRLKVSGGCVHCKRMWQLFELHSRMCSVDPCKVPLCRHFKQQKASRKEEMRWKVLVRKVQAASGAFSLASVSARLSQAL